MTHNAHFKKNYQRPSWPRINGKTIHWIPLNMYICWFLWVIKRLNRSVTFHNWWSWIIAINGHALIFSALSSGTNGIEWKSLLENKLNKDFEWDKVFQMAFAKKEEFTLEQVMISTMFCKKSLLLTWFDETPFSLLSSWPYKLVI